ncbi:hypothetical protein OIU74_019108 [Salix koriyanagi]|uniref:Uncharacterized protein n=1 Tax=Salix koriyanagi TaxID=2511006 RepID=A0A9Q1AIT2_9ROSI|nr:hypothetical protein OIU74_019108 [Salix koriyanagi]
MACLGKDDRGKGRSFNQGAERSLEKNIRYRSLQVQSSPVLAPDSAAAAPPPPPPGLTKRDPCLYLPKGQSGCK